MELIPVNKTDLKLQVLDASAKSANRCFNKQNVLLNCPRKKEARRIPGIKSSANSQQVLSNILLHFFEHLLAPASNSEQTAKTFRQFGQTLVFV